MNAIDTQLLDYTSKLIPVHGSVHLFLFWCPCMVINVIVYQVQYNGGFIPELIMLTLCAFIGNPFNTM